jgi:flagellar biosynthesis protein FliQ
MQSMSTENLFSRSWDLLSRNWAIIIPGLIVAIVAGILISLLTPAVYVSDGTYEFTGYTFLAPVVTAVIGVLAAIISFSYTTGMAAAAWRTGTATFADGAKAFQQEGGHVFTAMLALILVGIGAAILAPFTLGLTVLAVFFLCIYTMAAAVTGDFGGFAAIGESYRLAIARWQATAIIVVVLFVVSICALLIGALFHHIPFIGPLVSQIIQMIVLAYFTLVVVGEYLAARTPVAAGAGQATATTAPPPYTATPSAPPPPIDPTVGLAPSEPPPPPAPPPPGPPQP